MQNLFNEYLNYNFDKHKKHNVREETLKKQNIKIKL